MPIGLAPQLPGSESYTAPWGRDPIPDAPPPPPPDPPTTDPSDYGNRADGTPKGNGYFGPLQRPNGDVSTEISVGVDIDGKETEIPTLVPTLTPDEKNWLTTNDISDPSSIPASILQKATDFAQQRLAAGKSPFAGPDDYPAAPVAAPAAPPPVPYGAQYEPAVERWRPGLMAEFKAQGVPTVDSRGNDLIDKALHVLTYESHGDDTAVGDNGAAWGGFQDHHIPAGTPMAGQIASAVSLIKKNPDQWTDWGEGATYQGQPFGALGRVPYGSAAPTGAGIFGANSNGFTNLSSSKATIPTHYEPSSDEPLSGQAGRPVGGFRDTELQPDPNATTSDPFTAVGRGVNAIGNGIKTGFQGAENAASSIGPAALIGDATDTPEDPLTSAIALQRKAEDLTRDRRLQYLHEQAMKAGGGQLGPDGKVRPGGIGSTIAGVAVPDNVADVALMAEPFKDAIASRGKALIKTGAELAAPEAAPFGSAEYHVGLGGAPGFDAQEQLDRMAAEDAAKAEANKAAPNSIHFNSETNAFERTAPETTPPAGTTALSPPQRGADGLPEPAGAPPANEAPAGTSTAPPLSPWERAMQQSLDMGKDRAVSEGRQAAEDVVGQQRQAAQQSSGFYRDTGHVTKRANQMSAMLDDFKTAISTARAPSSAEDSLLDTGLHAGPTGKIGQSPLEKAIAERRGQNPNAINIPNNRAELNETIAKEKYLKGQGTAPPPAEAPKGPRFIDEAMAVLGLPQTIMASSDVGQIGRQAQILGWSHPEQWKEAAVAGIKAFGSEEAATAARAATESSPWYNFAHDVGLKIYDWGDAVTDASERVPGRGGLNNSRIARFTNNLGPVKASERSFATTLNVQGMSAFEHYATPMWEAGVRDQRQYQDLAQVINHARGYSNINPGAILPGFNTFFSGRNLASRFEVLLDPITKSGSLFEPSARQLAAKNLAAFIGGNAALMGLLGVTGSMAGGAWSVDADPRSSDFGKLRIGNTRIDTTAGFGPLQRLITRTGAEAIDATAGTHISRPQDDWRHEIVQFLRNKEAPLPAMLTDELSGKDSLGKPVTFGPDRLASMLTPFLSQDVVDAYRHNQGAAKLLAPAAGVASAVGLGASTYAPSLTDLRDKAAQQMGLKDYQSATPESRAQIDASAAVAKYRDANPSDYQQSKTAVEGKNHDIQEAARVEGAFDKQPPDKPIREYWHDASTAQRAIADSLSNQFAQQFSRFDQTKFDSALEAYYNIDKRTPEGNPDFDQTESARLDYLKTLPADQQQWLTEALNVSEAKKTPLHQEYDTYVQARKDSGYFAPNADTAALDKAHPDLDVQNWKFGGVLTAPDGSNATPSLNSPAAVDKALAMDLPGRQVKLAGLPRPINQDAKSLEAWNYSKKPLTWYDGQLIDDNWQAEAKRLATTTKDAGYAKPLDQMDASHRGIIVGNIHQKARQDIPELDAMLYWFGVGQKPTTQAGANLLPGIMQKFGNRPPVPAKP